MAETVRIYGSDGEPYDVPAELADMFYHGDGSGRLSDAEWDETKARYRENDIPWPFDQKE